MSPEISIIVPVYNAEKYIHECINNILSQSYEDFELILINDGSQDQTLSILKQFEKIDTRIKVLTKQNGGVSSARNYGLNISTGKWIAFIDADDKIDKNYLSHFIAHATDVDLVIGGFTSFGAKEIINKFDNCGIYEGEAIGPFLSENLKRMLLGVPWGKIYRRQIIEDYHLRFDEKIRFNEGYLFNQQFYCKMAKIYITSDTDYHWRIEEKANKYATNIKECIYTIITLKTQYDKLVTTWHIHNTDYIKGVFVIQTIRFLDYEAQVNAFNSKGYKAFKEELKRIDHLRLFFYLEGKSSISIAFFLLRNKLSLLLFIFMRFINPLIRKLRK